MIVVERSLKNVDWHSVLEMLSFRWYQPYFFDRRLMVLAAVFFFFFNAWSCATSTSARLKLLNSGSQSSGNISVVQAHPLCTASQLAATISMARPARLRAAPLVVLHLLGASSSSNAFQSAGEKWCISIQRWLAAMVVAGACVVSTVS